MIKKLQLIAEGDGDVAALPELVRRILNTHGIFDVQIATPTHKRGDLPKVKRRFNDYFQASAIENYPVLCVLDYDCDECHDVRADEAAFNNMAAEIRPNYPFQACFIVKEFESLFLWDQNAAKAVLPNIRPDYRLPSNPESIRDAKGELSKAQIKGWAYKPTVHQVAFSKKVNLDLLKTNSASYQRLENAVLQLAKSWDTQ